MGHPLYGKRQNASDIFFIADTSVLVIFMSAWFDSIILGGICVYEISAPAIQAIQS